MNDQSPGQRYEVRSEDRTEITFLDEPHWNSTVHKLIHAIDRGFERKGIPLEGKEPREKRGRDKTPKNLEARNLGLAAKLAKIEERRNEIATVMKRDPMLATAALADHFSVGESCIREIRRSIGLPQLVGGRNLRNKVAALLAENPELGNEEIASRIGTMADYVLKLRRRLGVPTRGRRAAKA